MKRRERIQAGNQAELSTSWIDHLKSLHPGWYFQSPGRNMLPADPAEHQADSERHAAMHERFKPNVTQLDWQFVPVLPGNPMCPSCRATRLSGRRRGSRSTS